MIAITYRAYSATGDERVDAVWLREWSADEVAECEARVCEALPLLSAP